MPDKRFDYVKNPLIEEKSCYEAFYQEIKNTIEDTFQL